MPILAALSLGLDVLCVIHALRARQPYYWYMIIFALPTVGALIYFFMEVLPDLGHSRAVRAAALDIEKVVDPDKEIRQATTALAAANTAENKKRLAEACIAKGRFEEARRLYLSALDGVHSDDPALLMGMARAQFGAKDYASLCETLDKLREVQPDFESPEGHMLYARAREALGDADQALVEYQALAGYCTGEEARCRYALLLQKVGQVEESRGVFAEVLRTVEASPKTYYRAQRDWYEVARRNLAD